MVTLRFHQDEGCGCGCGCGESSSPSEKWDNVPDDQIICHCANLDKKTLVEAIAQGAYTKPLLKIMTGIGRNKSCPNHNQCLVDAQSLIGTFASSGLAPIPPQD